MIFFIFSKEFFFIRLMLTRHNDSENVSLFGIIVIQGRHKEDAARKSQNEEDEE